MEPTTKELVKQINEVRAYVSDLGKFMMSDTLIQTISRLEELERDRERFITDVENNHFRTCHDTGANLNALLIWNLVRKWAGLKRLAVSDLRHYCEKCGRYHYLNDPCKTVDAAMEDKR